MKKYLKLAYVFATCGLLSGVFYREFTKMQGFEGRTTLGMVHPHILMLGLGGFLVLAIFVKLLNVQKSKLMTASDICYTAGLAVTSVMMLVRGTMEVAGSAIARSVSGMIAGIAGIGHMATAAGMIMYLVMLIRAEKANS